MSIERRANRQLVLTLIQQIVFFALAYGALYSDASEGAGRVLAVGVVAIALVSLVVTADRRGARWFGGREQRRLFQRTISDDKPLPTGIDAAVWRRSILRIQAAAAPWRVRVQWLGFGLSLTLAQTIARGDWTAVDIAFAVVFGAVFGVVAGQVMIALYRRRAATMRRLQRELDDRVRQDVR